MQTATATRNITRDRGLLARVRVSDAALAFFIFTTVFFNEGELVSVVSKVFLLLVTLFECVMKRKSPFNGFTVACLIFFAWSVASLSWSAVPSESVARIKTFFYQLVCYGCVSALVIDDKQALKISLVAFSVSSIASAAYVLGFQGIRFTDNRYVDGSVSSGQLALCIAFTMLLCMYEWRKARQGGYIALLVVLSLALLMTSARRDFIILLVFLVIFSTLGSGDIRKRIVLFSICVLVAVGLLHAVLNIDFLYQYLGRRIESFLQFAFAGGAGDASTEGRARLIDYGLDLFRSSPMLGQGVGSFEALFSTTHGSWQTSADNNYVELLADLGIPGFLAYYVPLVVFLVRRLRGITSASIDVQFAVSGIIAFATIDFACVWFFSKCGMLQILFFYLMAKSALSEKRIEEPVSHGNVVL